MQSCRQFADEGPVCLAFRAQVGVEGLQFRFFWFRAGWTWRFVYEERFPAILGFMSNAPRHVGLQGFNLLHLFHHQVPPGSSL